MGSSNNPSWPPFQPTRDCSKAICSNYCPQLCYYFFTPPPPFYLSDDSSPTLSPLVIALIALAAVALILIAYYTFIHRHRRRRRHLRTQLSTTTTTAAEEGFAAASSSPSGGLEESLINNITVCRYRRGSCLVDGTGCSVCLVEFKEDESLRMLPKCCHAFHLQCIDPWLKSHPNCPICRAGIIWVNPPPLSPVAIVGSAGNRPISENRQINEMEPVLQDSGTSFSRDEASKGPSGDTGGRTVEERLHVVEIREDGIQPIRPSSSIDVGGRVESSEGSRGEEDTNISRRNRVLPSDVDPSSINQARGRSGDLPV